MNGFTGVILKHDGLKFSDEHLRAIKACNLITQQKTPNHSGFYQDAQMVLSSRDVKKEEYQPFHFAEDRYCMVWDGEIYNADTLKKQLQEKEYDFYTNSQQEVIASLFLDKGANAFRELRGKFAVLIWDTKEKKLYGARDGFGIKPFYYMENEYDIVFSTEKKCISLLNQQDEIDMKALQHYFSFQFVPDPMTLTEGIEKLDPGHYFIKVWEESIQKYPYFHATFKPVKENENHLIRRIQEALIDSVQVHMHNGDPIGALLSGGIDSTIITAVAKKINPHLQTFSVGFQEVGYSEIDIAALTADKLRVENTSYVITPEAYIKQLPEIMWHMDDPLADPASIPLYFIGREAKKHVNTVLSGEGADELFGGYTIYREPGSLNIFEYLPDRLHKAINRFAAALPEGLRGKSFLERGTTPLRERYIGNAKIFEEAEKAQLMKYHNENATYQSWTADLFDEVEEMHPVEQMQYVDMHTWLTGDILLKADKMTKVHGLELRTPFLDKEIFRIARSITVDHKLTDGTTKAILRKAVKDIVPDHVVDRKKLGFPVPIKYWLKNELYSWAKNLIAESDTDDYINKDFVQKLLEKHALGKADYSRKIWTVLMFMLWHQIFIEEAYAFDSYNVKGESQKTS
jgi:asparagine synthase (glutamine-hydrolysing)